MKSLLITAALILSASAATSQQRPKITGIAFARFYAADPAASAAFYHGRLGLDHTTRDGMDIYRVSAAQTIEIAPLPSPAPQGRIAAVAFSTENAAALERYLRAHAIPIAQPLSHGTFGVRDPEGNLILFVQHRPAAVTGVPVTAAARRIIHAGFMVHDPAAEDRFFHDILGFRPYWRGGGKPDRIDWISQQVPDGNDWLEYMVPSSAQPSPASMGSMNHVSLGAPSIAEVVRALAHNGCTGPECSASKIGRDGKVQLNLFDPDLSRVEFMEFKPTGETCCSAFTAGHPSADDPE